MKYLSRARGHQAGMPAALVQMCLLHARVEGLEGVVGGRLALLELRERAAAPVRAASRPAS